MSNLLATVTTSEKRKNLLIQLREGPQSWEEIKTHLNVTASGMLPQIKILEEEELIAKEGGLFQLTDTGYLVAHHLYTFDKTLTVIDQQKKFWQEHDLRALPQDFFVRLGDLTNPQIVEAGLEESFEPHAQFLEMILKSKKVAGISPIVHPIYPRFFLSLAQEGREVRLILSKNAFTKIKKEYYDLLFEGVQFENAHLLIYEDNMKFAYIVTEGYFCLSLFKKNGIFDSNRDLTSTDPSAIKWGEDLFSYFSERSRPVNKEGRY